MFALLQVALTNLLLSSDNVLTIALMSHGVSHGRRRIALLLSLAASLALQLGILVGMAYLFRMAWLRLVFGVVICYMAFHLLRASHPEGDATATAGMHRTVLRITTGNLLMSFENEVALITLAHGNVWLAWAGVVLTSPLIFFGSHMVVEVLRRYSVIVFAGAVYLFSVGARLLVAGTGLGAIATPAAWVLTALFGLYALARYLRAGAFHRAGTGGRVP
jgi:predicted tellurium resistance membrane protein TerC